MCGPGVRAAIGRNSVQGKPATSTRQAIHEAGSALFRQQGYAKTTVRQIAAAAGSDPALVIRHFKSKELLFLETMQLTIGDEPLLGAPLEHLGERLIDLVIGIDGGARGVFLALVHGSNEPEIHKRLTDTHENVLIEPLRRRLSGPDADIRARLAASVAAGLLYSLWIARDETLLATDRTTLVARYGALVQHVLTPAA
nr:TetR family transcriptional regulator [Streptomyces sp. SID14446]